ncbi:hypothetical protein [Rhodoblastus sp.]
MKASNHFTVEKKIPVVEIEFVRVGARQLPSVLHRVDGVSCIYRVDS